MEDYIVEHLIKLLAALDPFSEDIFTAAMCTLIHTYAEENGVDKADLAYEIYEHIFDSKIM